MEKLPKALRDRVVAVCSRDAEVKIVIDELLAHVCQTGASETTGPDAVAEALQNATVFENLSLILPERRKVSLALKPGSVAAISGEKAIARGSWQHFSRALVLRLLDKPKPTWNVVLYNGADSAGSMVFTIQDQAADKFLAGAKPVSIRTVLLANFAKYAQDVVDDHAVAVTAHLGSKEGTLYFLESYIFYGFRKPLLLFPLEDIKSVSYTVVTRSTFNIVVKLLDGTEHEFSTVSHDDFDSINAYVLDHGLTNESLTEERKAKKARVEPTALKAAEEEAAAAPEDQTLADLEEGNDEEEEAGPNFQDGGSSSDGEDTSSDEEASGEENGSGNSEGLESEEENSIEGEEDGEVDDDEESGIEEEEEVDSETELKQEVDTYVSDEDESN